MPPKQAAAKKAPAPKAKTPAAKPAAKKTTPAPKAAAKVAPKAAAKKSTPAAKPAAKKGVTFMESAVAAEKKAVVTSKAPAKAVAGKKSAAAAAAKPAAKKAAVAAGAKVAGIVKPAAKKADASSPAKKTATEKKKEAKKDKKAVTFKKSANTKGYKVLQLRYLPKAFQEPELDRFLGQFGDVKNAFCARQKRTNASTGVAYVKMEDESLLPEIVEECNGMLLGGNVVRAKRVTLKRPMPHKSLVAERRFEDQKHRYRGDAIPRFDVSAKDAVASLITHSRTEKKQNETLKKQGIKYSFTGFQDQLKAVPKDLFKKKETRKTERVEKKEKAVAAKKEKKIQLKERHQKRKEMRKAVKSKKSTRDAKEAVVGVPDSDDE